MMINHRFRSQNLYNRDGVIISQQSEVICLTSFAKWIPAHAKLAKEFGVNCVVLNEDTFEDRTSVDFLQDLPSLRGVHIGFAWLVPPKDLSALLKLSQLEYIGLRGTAVRSPENGRDSSLDFTTLKHLRAADLEFTHRVESILHHPTLESLEIRNERYVEKFTELDLHRLTALKHLELIIWTKLKRVDLSAQPALERLTIEYLPKLAADSVHLHPKARLKALTIGRCGAYRLDWPRFARDLEELHLIGTQKFPLEEILQATHLRKLNTTAIRKFPPLRFLLQLEKLSEIFCFATPPGPKFSKDDRAVYQEIKARKSPQS